MDEMKRWIFIAIVALAAACGGDDELKKGTGSPGGGNATTPDGGASGNQSSPNSETSTSDPACVQLERNQIEFGRVDVGTTQTEVVRVTNCATADELSVAGLTSNTEVFDAILLSGETAQPGESIEVVVTFAPVEAGQIDGILQIDLGEGISPLDVALTGTGVTPGADCVDTVARVRVEGSADSQESIIVQPLVTLELDSSGSASDFGAATSFEWSVIARPAGSSAVLSDNSDPSPLFLPDRPGDYRIQLVATDDAGNTSCEPAVVEIAAVVDEPGTVFVELTWVTPLDPDETDEDGTDLDLHWLRQSGNWNTPPYDCFWDNPAPDWGPSGPEGNPDLGLEDLDGAGPERVRHSGLEAGITYEAGVYYYNASSFGASYATVRIYRDGQLIFEAKDRFLGERGDFWRVASLEAPDIITSIDVVRAGFP